MAESFYDTDNFTIEFCHQFRLDKWDKVVKMPLQKPVLRKDGQRLQEINIWIHQATVIVRTLKDRNTVKHMHILILHPIVSAMLR